jgi:hypothetical protein
MKHLNRNPIHGFCNKCKRRKKQPITKTITRLKTTQLIETKIYGQEEYRVATENKTTINKKQKKIGHK